MDCRGTTSATALLIPLRIQCDILLDRRLEIKGAAAGLLRPTAEGVPAAGGGFGGGDGVAFGYFEGRVGALGAIVELEGHSALCGDILAETGQDRSDLGTGRVPGRVELPVVAAVDETRGIGPLHGIHGVAADFVCVGEFAQVSSGGHVIFFVGRVAIQDRGHLLAGDVLVGTKGVRAETADDPILRCPSDGLFIVFARGHILEWASPGGGRLTL